MATTGFWPVKGKLKAVIVYAENPNKTMNPKFFDSDLYATLQYAENSNKTDQELFVSGINCSKHNAYAQMVAVKKKFGERGTVVVYHGYQSFKENEVTPEECHEMGIETARRMWGDKYQVIVTTHLDKKHHDFYDEIEVVEEQITELQSRIANIKEEKISGENVYLFLHYYGIMYEEFTDAEKKKFLNTFIESVEIFKEEQPDGRLLKCINFKFPVFYDGDENVTHIRWDSETTVECVAFLMKK